MTDPPVNDTPLPADGRERLQSQADRERFYVTENGVTLVTPAMLRSGQHKG